MHLKEIRKAANKAFSSFTPRRFGFTSAGLVLDILDEDLNPATMKALISKADEFSKNPILREPTQNPLGEAKKGKCICTSKAHDPKCPMHKK